MPCPYGMKSDDFFRHFFLFLYHLFRFFVIFADCFDFLTDNYEKIFDYSVDGFRIGVL